MDEIRELLEKAMEELREEGLNPDILLAGPGFIEHAFDVLRRCGIRVYRIEELDYDAVVADSKFLGQMKKASRRISLEPFLLEVEVWEELKRLEV
ncbi:family 4B encapsulin nanocompartment shell protein [Thermococcus sp.]|uniref:family 4B encapsulin nanocompartment shell protein n=1 Tax=Thermococcus sp. TaxID=35749 RepID=UPI00261815E6|nr:family 4B encapsulin nanocompartment shell protein [Thermococcus sp.]